MPLAPTGIDGRVIDWSSTYVPGRNNRASTNLRRGATPDSGRWCRWIDRAAADTGSAGHGTAANMPADGNKQSESSHTCVLRSWCCVVVGRRRRREVSYFLGGADFAAWNSALAAAGVLRISS